jgi:hypothetical protein
MRMWGVPAHLLCRQHLLGEHVEMHMFVGTIRKKISIQGYVDRGLVNPARIYQRHQELVVEMLARGMNHQSPLLSTRGQAQAAVDVPANIKELYHRCPECRKRIEADR